MNEPLDPLLRALGEVERDLERRHPAAWERALAGEADPEDVAAARAAIDAPEEQAVFKDMFSRPASEAELEALIGRAAAVLGGAKVEAVTPTPTKVEAAAAEPAKVIPLAPRRSRVLAAVSIATAIAAALLLWRFTAIAPQADFGAYGLTVRDSAVQALRSTDTKAEVSRYRLDSEIDWVLSPEREVGRVVDLRVVARAPGGWEELIVPVFTRSPAGALRLRGRLADVLPIKPGRWRLAFVVSAAGQAPEAAAGVAGAVKDGQAIVLPATLEVEIEAAPAGP